LNLVEKSREYVGIHGRLCFLKEPQTLKYWLLGELDDSASYSVGRKEVKWDK
jgi:hypothetical protein